MKATRDDGALLYASHALQPNSLGYCGPDENRKILEALHESSVSEGLISTLTRFEAAYPFVKMIAESSGRQAFDRKVTEAYWIGNSLLEAVNPAEFYQFTKNVLGPSRRRAGKREGMTSASSASVFKKFGEKARPHHTFYVVALHDNSQGSPEVERKILGLMDSCRVSWGKVLVAKKSTLVVERPSLEVSGGRLALTPPVRAEVRFDPAIPSFAGIAPGDHVSIHWNFASSRLTPTQLKGLEKYTGLAIDVANSQQGKKSRPRPD